jgi:hypothetical protein
MQKEFNKLTIQKKRKFIVKNLLKDEYFIKVHDKFKTLFIEDAYTKAEQKQQSLIKNEYIINKITCILTNYKDNIIDLHCNPSSEYFYKQALQYKNKLYKIFDLNFLNYKDENNFYIHQLILDTWIITKEIIVKLDTSIEDIILRMPYYSEDIIDNDF